MKTNIGTLVFHDLAIAFKNKTFILLLCIPLFVYGLMAVVNKTATSDSRISLALVENGKTDPSITVAINSIPEIFSFREVHTVEEGLLLLKNGEIDGLLTAAENNRAQVGLTVLKKDSPATLVITQAFLSLQIATMGTGSSWISDISAVQASAPELQSLPTWILMVILLVALFVLPAQVAEEKEKQWLSGLLQTPMTEQEWLAAKVIFTTLLMFVTVLVLQFLGGQFALPWTYYVTVLLGGYCFNSIGLAVGLLCRNQATARTFGVILYLPLLVPVALSDASTQFLKIARWTPSFALYEPLQEILLYGGTGAVFFWPWIFLVVLGSAACVLSFKLIRVRWAMH